MRRLSRVEAHKNGFFKALTLATALGVLSTGCGKDHFDPVTGSESFTAAGSFEIPAKIDIVMAEDDTGSMQEAYSSIAAQVPGFLNSLGQSGWDFHFSVVPLTTDRAVTQALASTHDSNWGSQWTPAYPGQVAGGPGMLASNIFRFPWNYSGMISNATVDESNSKYAREYGLYNIEKALYQRMPGTGILRNDALLVVFALSTGDDSSGINYCTRSDGITVPCSDNSATSSLNAYVNSFQNLRPAGNVRFYSAVAHNQGQCFNSAYAFRGSRYIEMSSRLSGQSYDICNNSISNIFSSVANSLASTRIQYRTRYVFIGKEPNVSTLKVLRNGVELKAGDPNGYVYKGYLTNVYAIDYPVSMNQSSGYAIELMGSAKLTGADKIDVQYQPAGVSSSTN